MDLSTALTAYGSSPFHGALAEELLRHKSWLPTERACLAGGWPMNERIIAVGGESESPESVFADVVVSFDEVLNPSCGTRPHQIPRTLACRVTIDKKTGGATVRATEAEDPPEEF